MASHLSIFIFITSTIFPTYHSLNAFPPAPFLLPERELNFQPFQSPQHHRASKSEKLSEKAGPTERIMPSRRMVAVELSTKPMRGWIWKDMQAYKRDEPLQVGKVEFPLKERVTFGYPQSAKALLHFYPVTLRVLPEEKDNKRLLDLEKQIYSKARNKKYRKAMVGQDDFIHFMKGDKVDESPDWMPHKEYYPAVPRDNVVYSSSRSFRGVADGRRSIDRYFKEIVMPKLPELWDSQYHV